MSFPLSLSDCKHRWQNAMLQVYRVQRGAITVKAMCDGVHHLGVPSGKISPTSHSGVLLMQSQALMCRINYL